MSYYLGKVSKTEYLLLKNQNKITFELSTTCFQGSKKYFNNNYLNVLNPDNFIYNLETEIQEFVKDKLTGLELKSNIIYNSDTYNKNVYNKKQFLQFKLDNDVPLIEPESNLKLTIELDKLKINEKTNSYHILLKLIKYEKINKSN
jgi:hypothetical protein